MRYLKATNETGGAVAVGARRWSTATQSITGVSNTSHQSLHLSNTGPEEGRKISFVLQGDQDNESIGSSKNSLCGDRVSCYFKSDCLTLMIDFEFRSKLNQRVIFLVK